MRGFLIFASLVLLAMGSSVSVSPAQPVAPLRLTPLATPGESPQEPARDGAPEATKPAYATSANGVVVQRLGNVDEDAVGVLAPGQGGLESDVWRGSSRALIADLLDRIPGEVKSRPLRDLLRRLLLTTAPPPVAANDADGDVSIVALRARLLIAMGARADADALIAATGRATAGRGLAWPTFEARLLAGDAAGACGIVRGRGVDLAGLDWQKALIFCHLLAERTDQAQFGLNLLREKRVTADPLFFALAEGLAAGAAPQIDAAIVPGTATPLNLALLRLAWAEVPKAFLAVAPPGIVAAVARAPDTPDVVRLASAIRAETGGAMSAAEVRAIFERLTKTPQELAAALTIADSEPPERAMALLYLAARAQDVPAARAEVLQRLWEIALENGIAGTMARVAAPLLGDIPLLAEFSWFAGTAARMALYTDDLPRALGWYDAVVSAAVSDREAGNVAAQLWPLMRLALGDVRRLPPQQQTPAQDVAKEVIVAGGAITSATGEELAAGRPPAEGEVAVPWDSRRLDAWLALGAEHFARQMPHRTGRLLALFDAVGEPVGDAQWRAGLPARTEGNAQSTAHPAYRLGMSRAAAGGRRGETILFAVATLAGHDAAAVDAATLHRLVRALVRVGYGPQARALARDVALAAGL